MLKYYSENLIKDLRSFYGYYRKVLTQLILSYPFILKFIYHICLFTNKYFPKNSKYYLNVYFQCCLSDILYKMGFRTYYLITMFSFK